VSNILRSTEDFSSSVSNIARSTEENLSSSFSCLGGVHDGGGCAVEGGRGGASTNECGEMAGLGFRGSGALKKKNSSDTR
jgi:hypothetical protein